MKIIDLLKKDAIALNVSLTDKEEAIDKLISLHEKSRKSCRQGGVQGGYPCKRGSGLDRNRRRNCRSARKIGQRKDSRSFGDNGSERR